jgi:hypothetical protein
VLPSRPPHHRDYPALLQKPEYAHLKLVRLYSPRETDKWLERAKRETQTTTSLLGEQFLV